MCFFLRCQDKKKGRGKNTVTPPLDEDVATGLKLVAPVSGSYCTKDLARTWEIKQVPHCLRDSGCAEGSGFR